MANESVTISLKRYNELKDKSDFFNSEYVIGKFNFPDGSKSNLWIKDEVLQEIEEDYKLKILEYKAKVRHRNTFKFWKWRLTIKTIK